MKHKGCLRFSILITGLVASLTVGLVCTPLGLEKSQVGARPVLHLDVGGTKDNPEFFLSATTADGHHIGKFPAAGTAWSPDGTWFAFFTDRGRYLNLASLNREHKRLFEFSAKTGTSIGWQPSWSPDGKTIASITRDNGSHYWLVLISSASGKVISAHALPDGIIQLPYYLSPADQFRWSPDGHKILISWDKCVVFDLTSLKVSTISAEHVVSEWAGDSDGIYYLESQQNNNARSFSGLYYPKLDGGSRIKLEDTKGIQKIGLRIAFLNRGLMSLSPSGSELAISGGGQEPGTGRLLVYSLHPGEKLILDKPSETFELGGVVAAL